MGPVLTSLGHWNSGLRLGPALSMQSYRIRIGSRRSSSSTPSTGSGSFNSKCDLSTAVIHPYITVVERDDQPTPLGVQRVRHAMRAEVGHNFRNLTPVVEIHGLLDHHLPKRILVSMTANLCSKFTYYRDLTSSGKHGVLLNLVVMGPGDIFYAEHFAPAGLSVRTLHLAGSQQ
ncbi:hypothetical protein N5P37_002876 [Trichoderma harzianum]|nr:hypothetical protein N5P37_002876 [Trichoderma harzianum]